MKQRTSQFDRECSYCGASIPAGKLAWGEQEGLTEHVECDECHEKVPCARCGKRIDEETADLDAIDSPVCPECCKIVSKWPSQRADMPNL